MSESSPGLVGVPVTERMSTRCAAAHVELAQKLPDDAEFKYLRGGDRLEISRKRNRMAERVVRAELDWLFFIDSDTLFNWSDARSILTDLGCTTNRDRIDIACGVVPSRKPMFGPNVARYDGPLSDDPLRPSDFEGYALAEKEHPDTSRMDRWGGYWPAHTCGMAFTAISRRVLEAMERPWFADNVEREHSTGHDTNFTLRATRRHGFTLAADLGVRPMHLTPDWGVTLEYGEAYREHKFRSGWGPEIRTLGALE